MTLWTVAHPAPLYVGFSRQASGSAAPLNALQWLIYFTLSNPLGQSTRLYMLARPQPHLLTSLSHLSTSSPWVHCVLATVAPLLFFKNLGSSLCWVFARAIPSAWHSLSQHSHITGSLSSFQFSLKYLTIWRLILITLFKFAKCQSPILSPYHSGLFLKLIDL